MGTVSNLLDAASGRRQAGGAPPRWLEARPDDPDPREVLSVRNGLLHIPTRTLTPPTPRFFTQQALPFDHDPEAPPPRRWLRFLEEVWPDERDCREALQQFMGYLLTPDTSLQKVVVIVGPPRSGKGTIDHVLHTLLGPDNCCGPTAEDLAGDFGLQGLLGKRLATVTDMRLGRASNTSKLAQNLLRVSGEDRVTVNRKYKEPWNGVLPTQFLLLSNEVPQIRDTSGALHSRFLFLQMRQSFLRREDTSLRSELEAEAQGILNWALEGREDLRFWGRIEQPGSAREVVELAAAVGSPVRTFVEERCAVAPDRRVGKDEFFEAFATWCLSEGITYGGGRPHLMRDLNAALQGARVTEVRGERPERKRLLVGIGLRDGDD
jgi:putative DNA primase/helicase